MHAQRWECTAKMIRGITLMLLCLAPIAARAAGDEGTTGIMRLTLAECIQRAVEDHPSVQEVKWEVAIRESDVEQAMSGFYPTAEFVNLVGVVNNARGNIHRFHQSGVWGIGPFFRVEGQIVYPIFTWWKVTNGLKAAQKGVQQENVNVEQKKAEAIREVKEYYYTLVYTKQIQELLTDVRTGFEKAVQTADERLRAGKVSQLDVLNLKVGYAGVAKETRKLQNGIELSRGALLRVMGLGQETAFDVADTTLTPQAAQLKDLKYYEDRLFANRPEWRRLRIGIQAKEAELAMARSDYYPTFFFSMPVRYGYAPGRSRQTNPFAYDDFNFGAAGPVLGLHWKFDIGETSAKVSRSQAELMKLQSQEKNAATSFPLEVKEAYLNVQEAEERMRITSDGRKAGRALVALSTTNFELGIGEPQDIFQGLGNYTRAANDYYEAVRDYNIALAKLSLVVGEEVSELRY
ncbi:MAG: TolC family protein [Deltaproteobacteria bacterium]|nr:TolC family protein [Deltaproteobacteria bacterium]